MSGQACAMCPPVLSTLRVPPQSALTCPELWGSLSLLGITRLHQVLQVNRPVTCPSLSKSYLHSVLFTSDLTDYFPFSETANFSIMIITFLSNRGRYYQPYLGPTPDTDQACFLERALLLPHREAGPGVPQSAVHVTVTT